MKKIKTRLALTFFCLCLLLLSAQSGLAQNTAAAAQNPSNADESANSTVIYTADSFIGNEVRGYESSSQLDSAYLKKVIFVIICLKPSNQSLLFFQ